MARRPRLDMAGFHHIVNHGGVKKTVRETKKDNKIIQEKHKTLKEHFRKTEDLARRNKDIVNAIEDGYKQSEIASYLKVSPDFRPKGTTTPEL